MQQAKAAEQQIRDNLEEKKQLLRNMEEEKQLSIYQEILEQECLLSAENISFSYEGGREPVLEGVTLHVYPGDKIWLRGENGAGKTTLLKLLSGKLQATGISYKEEYFKAQLESALQNDELTLIFVDHNEEFGNKIANKGLIWVGRFYFAFLYEIRM